MMSLRVLTWNINFRSAASVDRLAVVGEPADVLTLQEVTLGQAADIESHLRDLGFTSFCYSGIETAAEKHYGNPVAARSPITPGADMAEGFPWPQLVAHCSVETPAGVVNVITVHVPNGSSNGWKKIDMLEALKRLVLRLKGRQLAVASAGCCRSAPRP